MVCPIQGKHITNMSPDSAHTRQHRPEMSPVSLSRISHLSNIYYELAQARQKYFLDDPNVNTNPRHDLLSTLGKVDLDSNDNPFKTDHVAIVQTAFSPAEHAASWRSKRQQGWYIQYGKRNHRAIYSTDKHRTLPSTKIKDNTQKTGFVPYSQGLHSEIPYPSTIAPLAYKDTMASVKAELFKYSELLHNLDDVTSKSDFMNNNLYTHEEATDRALNSVGDQGLQPEIFKRQQGWFISYGKRSDRHL